MLSAALELIDAARRIVRDSQTADMAGRHPRTLSREFLSGGGELATLIRQKDWSQTPLGPVEKWPQSLRTAVSLCLASNFPINIIWGAEHTQIYNDGYRDCCGDAHPRALGEDYSVTWASAWPAIGESFERASAGETMYLENQRMFLSRLNGALEETFFTFSHSPIRDESGGVGGLFHPVTETTATIISERRTRALRDLGASLNAATDEAEVARRTVQILSRFAFDLPFLLFYSLDPKASCYRLAGHYGITPGRPAAPLSIEFDAAGPWPFAEALASLRIVEVNELPVALQGEPCGPYQEPPNLAFVVPVVVPAAERPPAVIVTAASARLPLNADYRSFYDLLSVTISGALAAVRAYEDERRRAEALAEIDRAKTAFFANVSHEFRTPLTLMLGPLEDALADTGLRAVERERLDIAHRNSLRLLKLVNSLLDFSRIESGWAQAIFEPVDLGALTAELASNFRSACQRAGLRLAVDCPPLPQPVYIDRDMWEKIVLNLLSNAFKFTFEGEIAVRLRGVDRHAELSVRDTGVGVPEHELPRLFERFHRIEGQESRTYEGSGIGLALVQELVKLHGGTIRAESAVGQGAAFTVGIPFGTGHLPRERIGATRSLVSTSVRAQAYVEEALRWLPDGPVPMAEAPSEPDAAGAVPRQRRGARVLVADDNADMRAYVCRLLGGSCEVQTVADGKAALEAIRERRPDLLLADVMMPRLDGFGLLRTIRADPVLRDLPVIMLSARAGEESRVEGLEAGADDYLIKPFPARELLARVDGSLLLSRVRRDADHALRQSEARLRAIFGGTYEYIGVLSPDGTLLDANRASLEFAGSARGEVVGRLFWETVWFIRTPGAPEKLRQAIARAAAGEFIRYEAPLARPSGEVVTFDFSLHPVRDEVGQVILIVAEGRDITERKRAEAALRDSRAQLEKELAAAQRLQEASARLMQEGDAHALYDPILAAAIAITHSDMASMQMLDPERGELQLLAWKGFGSVSAAFWERVRADSGSSCGMALRTGQRVIVPDIETCNFIVDTPEFDAYRRLGVRAVQSTPLVSRYGRTLGMISTHWREPHQPAESDVRLLDVLARQAADLIERANAEAELRESEAQFHTLAESIPQLAWMARPDGWIFWYNQRWYNYTGTTLLEMQGWGWRKVHHPDHEQRVVERIQRSWDTGEPWEDTFPLRAADGGYRWFLSRAVPIRDAEGRIVRWFGTNTDVTEQREAQEAQQRASQMLEERVAERTRQLTNEMAERRKVEAALQQARHLEAIGQLTGGVAHDFNNLLTVVAGQSEGIAAAAKDDDIRRRAAAIQRAAERGARLTGQLLAFARRQRLSPQRVTIARLMADIDDLVRRAVGESVAVEFGADPDLWPSLVDPTQFESAILNLAINAKDAMPGGGRLAIVARNAVVAGAEASRLDIRPGDYVVVSVADTGTGMPADIRDHAFEPFFTTKDVGKGTGLGLAQTYGFVRQSGGAVALESTVGHGTTVSLHLPRAEAEAVEELALPSEPIQPGAGNGY